MDHLNSIFRVIHPEDGGSTALHGATVQKTTTCKKWAVFLNVLGVGRVKLKSIYFGNTV
jgi:hypothetical protein